MKKVWLCVNDRENEAQKKILEQFHELAKQNADFDTLHSFAQKNASTGKIRYSTDEYTSHSLTGKREVKIGHCISGKQESYTAEIYEPL